MQVVNEISVAGSVIYILWCVFDVCVCRRLCVLISPSSVAVPMSVFLSGGNVTRWTTVVMVLTSLQTAVSGC